MPFQINPRGYSRGSMAQGAGDNYAPFAAWQTGGKGGGGTLPAAAPAETPISNLTNWLQGQYPGAPTTPQPLESGYGSGAWNILDPFSGGAGMGGGAATQINTGITQPNMPGAPTMPNMPAGPEGMGGMANQGMAANWSQAMEPEFMQQMAGFFPQQAGLQGGFENAQAQAGLGWGGIAQGQQGNLMRFLQGLV